jgi:dCTP deaminase
MILSDREIRAAMSRGAVSITPDPPAEAWSSTAVDLHLAHELSSWKKISGKGVKSIVCPGDPEYDFAGMYAAYSESVVMDEKGHDFEPGGFLLAWTSEKIKLPFQSRVAARVEGKSSLARLGIGIHVTAPTIHAGFGYKKDVPEYAGSPLQLEMWNVGPLTIRIVPGMRICQLIFEIVDGTPEKGYDGQFSVQGPTG